jgi:UDP-N-acetylmuramate dehydrogenase
VWPAGSGSEVILDGVPTFAEITTLRVGGPIETLIDAASPTELIESLQAADAAAKPVIILGGGSNVVAPDAGAPLVLRPRFSDLRVITAPSTGQLQIEVEAGLPWSDLVDRAIDSGWSGFESLAGIPGTVGAAPVQNIGAYGHEVAELIAAVTVWDRRADTIRRLTPTELAFTYRSSLLKQSALSAPQTGPGLIVLAVTFNIGHNDFSRPLAYSELAGLLGAKVGDRLPLQTVADGVLALRRSKGMVLNPLDHDTWSTGSLFTNPILPPDLAANLPAVAPTFPAGQDSIGRPLVKTSAARLISQAGIERGWGLVPSARTSTKHVLALTNCGSATASEILALATAIIARVEATYGITLTPEPVIL